MHKIFLGPTCFWPSYFFWGGGGFKTFVFLNVICFGIKVCFGCIIFGIEFLFEPRFVWNWNLWKSYIFLNFSRTQYFPWVNSFWNWITDYVVRIVYLLYTDILGPSAYFSKSFLHWNHKFQPIENSILSNSSPKSKVQTSVLGLGVDFVFPLSQQQEQQPPPKSIRRGCNRNL